MFFDKYIRWYLTDDYPGWVVSDTGCQIQGCLVKPLHQLW